MISLRTLLASQLATLILLTGTTFAQGTAGSPSTVHTVDASTNIVWIGGPNDTINGSVPIPIDLDASGGPWRKQIWSDPISGYGGVSLLIRETIVNAGTEPWTDWHETLLNLGSHSGSWGSVTDMRINGTSITFNPTITGGTQLDLDTFSQPVLPGQVLEIDKQLGPLPALFVGPNTLVNTLLEYPTATIIPEPTTGLLIALGMATVLGVRRRPCSQS